MTVGETRSVLCRSLACLFLLAVVAPASAVAARPTPARRHRAPRLPPPVVMNHVSTHETWALRPDPSGRLGTRQLRAARHFLRCHHTGREHAMAPRLLQLLYQTSRHFHGATIEVVAGYRAPRIAREKGNPKSHHKEGRACDFRLAGVPNTAVRDYLRRTYQGVGVGYYPNAGFVHLDVRRKNGYWIDYSSPGEPARYTEEPPPDDTEPAPDAAPVEIDPAG